jgi:hypothetical protein
MRDSTTAVIPEPADDGLAAQSGQIVRAKRRDKPVSDAYLMSSAAEISFARPTNESDA